MAIAKLLLLLAAPPEWKAAEALVLEIGDFEASFESNSFSGKRPEDAMFNSGVFRVVLAEAYSFEDFEDNVEKTPPYRHINSNRRGGRMKQRMGWVNPKLPPISQGFVEDASLHHRVDSPLSFFPWPRLLWVPQRTLDSITLIGEEKIGDLNCLKFQLSYGSSEWDVFVSMERGGQVVLIRDYMDSARRVLWTTMETTRFNQIADAKGKIHWFPTAMKKSRHWNPETRRSDPKPNYWTDFIFVKGRIKLNTGLSADDVEVKFDSRMPVDDPKGRKLQNPIPAEDRGVKTSAAKAGDVKKALAEADAQKAMLDDRRPAALPDDSWPWTWIVGIGALVLGAGAIYLKVRQGG